MISAAAATAGQRWLWLPLVFCTAGTGAAAVLHATGQIFVGWGPVPSEEDQSPTDQDREKAARPLWLMMLPTAVPLAAACLGAAAAGRLATSAAAMLMQPGGAAMPGPIGSVAPVLIA